MLLPNRNRWDEPPQPHPSQPGSPWPDAIHDALTFRHVRLTTPAELEPLLAFYGLDAGPAAARPETLLAEVSLQLDPAALAAWSLAPAERTARHFEVFRNLSQEIQVALRRWVGYDWLRDPAQYGDPQLCHAILVYSSSLRRRAKARSELTYDVLSPHTPRLACRSSLPRFRTELERIHGLLLSSAHPAALNFEPHRASKYLHGLRRHPRDLLSMLFADSELVERCVRLSGLARSAAGEDSARPLARLFLDFLDAATVRLRHFYRGSGDFAHLAPMVLIHATAVLNREWQTDNAARVRVRLTAASGKQQVLAGFIPCLENC